MGPIAPNRVAPGNKLPGQMGHVTRTIQNLEVVAVDPENNLLLIKGSVPGPKKGLVVVKTAIKKAGQVNPVHELVDYTPEEVEETVVEEAVEAAAENNLKKEEMRMLNVKVFNQEGAEVKDLELNEAVFGIEPHKQAMFDMVLLQRASLRQGTHKVKNRTEVAGGGRKPWRQKGTGRARQGSTRAPQWRGGGVVFGPTPRSYKFKLNRKVRRLALKSALSSKVQDNEFTAIDGISFEAPKTKQMVKVLENLNAPVKTLIVVDEITLNVEKSASNIPGVKLLDAKHVNVYDILNSDKLIMTEAAIKAVEEVLA